MGRLKLKLKDLQQRGSSKKRNPRNAAEWRGRRRNARAREDGVRRNGCERRLRQGGSKGAREGLGWQRKKESPDMAKKATTLWFSRESLDVAV
ncbi:uncharacterized protein G2W53_020245 [Senna tora]|uniref:Uncharacterized protein n=1 Tax=Senna tora TaxID=362788 RepID=A0A834TYP9_9FABA|nr:uncharacterized protein G2W53_020245 [Senna tora]